MSDYDTAPVAEEITMRWDGEDWYLVYPHGHKLTPEQLRVLLRYGSLRAAE